MCQPNQSSEIYPVVVVEVEGIKCRALLDTGSGNSYVSSTLMNLTKKKPARQEIKTIEMMLHTTTKKIDVCNVQITDVFWSELCWSTLPNPRYREVIANNPILEGEEMDDSYSKPNVASSHDTWSDHTSNTWSTQMYISAFRVWTSSLQHL